VVGIESEGLDPGRPNGRDHGEEAGTKGEDRFEE
jgi:hypothetical protein